MSIRNFNIKIFFKIFKEPEPELETYKEKKISRNLNRNHNPVKWHGSATVLSIAQHDLFS